MMMYKQIRHFLLITLVSHGASIENKLPLSLTQYKKKAGSMGFNHSCINLEIGLHFDELLWVIYPQFTTRDPS